MRIPTSVAGKSEHLPPLHSVRSALTRVCSVGICVFAMGLMSACSPSAGSGSSEVAAKLASSTAAACKETAGTSSVDASADCSAPQVLDPFRLARRLSLDLRGQPPTYDEYAALEGATEVPESLIDGWMESDGFRLQMRRYHESLLWTNPTGVQIVDITVRLTTVRTTDGVNTEDVYAILANNRRTRYRGTSAVVCGPWEQTEFNADGTPVAKNVYDAQGTLLYVQEGWVPVKPYWDPNTTLKVCAFDAQTVTQGKTSACNTREAIQDKTCGCGPSLQWCFGPPVTTAIWNAMREQVGLAVDDVTVKGAPYTELVVGQKLYMNGQLEFFKKHLAQLVLLNRTYNDQGPGDPTMPENPSYTDATWRTYTRTDAHAGVLTMPGYSLRFQTNRARANRFRIAFTGQYFIPASQPEDPSTADCLESTGDLTQMCTCRSCHQVLEPLAAHFAAVSEAGSRLLTDFPEYSATCDPRNYGEGTENPRGQVPNYCGRFYAINTTDQNPGWRLTHQYAYRTDSGFNNAGLDDALHKAIAQNLESGPEGLAQEVISSGQLATATVRHLFQHLMRRDMDLDPSSPDAELELLTTLSAEFSTDYDFKKLVKRLVLLPQYQRVNP